MIRKLLQENFEVSTERSVSDDKMLKSSLQTFVAEMLRVLNAQPFIRKLLASVKESTLAGLEQFEKTIIVKSQQIHSQVRLVTTLKNVNGYPSWNLPFCRKRDNRVWLLPK